VFSSLGEFDRAAPLLERAVTTRSQFASDDELALAGALFYQATLLDLEGHYEKAEAPARRSVEIRERRLGDHPDLAFSLNTLGNVLWHQGRLDEAEAIHRRALALRESTLPPGHTDIGQSVHNLGALRYFAGDLAEAESLWRRSAAIEEANHGPNDWNLATSLHTLAIVCQDQDRFDEALALEQRSLAVREKVLGPDHPHVALSLTTLGNIYRGMGDPAAAEPAIRRAIAIAEAAWGPTYGEVFWMRRSLARTMVDRGKFDDAEAELDGLLAAIEAAGADDEAPQVLEILGSLYVRQGRYGEAERLYLQAITDVETNSFDEPYLGLLTAELARVYRDTGRRDEAEASMRRAVEMMEASWGPDDPDSRQAAADLEALAAEPKR